MENKFHKRVKVTGIKDLSGASSGSSCFAARCLGFPIGKPRSSGSPGPARAEPGALRMAGCCLTTDLPKMPGKWPKRCRQHHRPRAGPAPALSFTSPHPSQLTSSTPTPMEMPPKGCRRCLFFIFFPLSHTNFWSVLPSPNEVLFVVSVCSPPGLGSRTEVLIKQTSVTGD